MRPIVSGLDSSKWLVNEYKNLYIKVNSLEVENSLEFVDKVNNIKLEQF